MSQVFCTSKAYLENNYDSNEILQYMSVNVLKCLYDSSFTYENLFSRLMQDNKFNNTKLRVQIVALKLRSCCL